MNDQETIANVVRSNIEFAPVSRYVVTWRWLEPPQRPVLVYLERPTDDKGQDYADKTRKAIDTINRRMKGLLALQIADAKPLSDNYIHVSYGTSYVGGGDYRKRRANVATGKNCGEKIRPSRDHGIASHPVYMNLGNARCGVTLDIVIHEFGHALGLAEHFEGFGLPDEGPPVDPRFWDALATLYANRPGTQQKHLKAKQAAP